MRCGWPCLLPRRLRPARLSWVPTSRGTGNFQEMQGVGQGLGFQRTSVHPQVISTGSGTQRRVVFVTARSFTVLAVLIGVGQEEMAGGVRRFRHPHPRGHGPRVFGPPTANGVLEMARFSDEKWAQSDLNRRPPGYQPGAPAKLSYGPAGPGKASGRYPFRIQEARWWDRRVGSYAGDTAGRGAGAWRVSVPCLR